MDEQSLVDEALGGVATEGLDPLQAREGHSRIDQYAAGVVSRGVPCR